MTGSRDHGGNLDAAILRFGGDRTLWADLSTGINPVPFPLPPLPDGAWTALPDAAARDALLQAARRFWRIPDDAALIATPGASAAIAHIPLLAPPGHVHIPAPTYNEHAAAFRRLHWQVSAGSAPAAHMAARVLVHPNNPTGVFHPAPAPGPLTVIDESFCDVAPERSLAPLATRGDTLILKSFGKFWGLAGLRLGFVTGPAPLVDALSEMLGPWPVSGPALAIGTAALSDQTWAGETRARLTRDAARLDTLMQGATARILGGTPLFRLYEVPDAAALQSRLAAHHVWSRTFPYDPRWIRLGLPAPDRWDQLERALDGALA